MAAPGTSTIHAAEHMLADIFGAKFRYRIPAYQRPYSWEPEHAVSIVEDIEEARKAQPDYFLGSLVLVEAEDEQGLYDVIDGQQRLTTLTLLWAVLMRLIPDDEAGGLRSFVWQEAEKFKNLPKSVRLKVPDDVRDFFEAYVQRDHGIESLLALDPASLDEVQRRYRDNAVAMIEALGDHSEDELSEFALYLAQHAYLVSVITSHFDSAYRIFSVMNDRGLELTASDILKAEVIGKIDEDRRAKYAETWTEVEADLGRDRFGDLFTHLRMIHLQRKAQTTTLKELQEHVVPKYEPMVFVDDVVAPYGGTLLRITDAAWQSSTRQQDINRLLAWLGELDNFDWTPPTLEFLQRNAADADLVYKFLVRLDRFASSMFLRRTYLQTRIKRYAKVLAALDDPDTLLAEDGPLALTPEDQRETLDVLRGEVYGSRITRFVVKRLDAHLADSAATWDHKVISIEHVLPQHPQDGSQWWDWFTEEQHRLWVHRIANLVPLNRQRNSAASNYELGKKLTQYFRIKGQASPFVLTNEVLGLTEWTPKMLEERQERLVAELSDLWNLKDVTAAGAE